jgi:hypothetical protein
MNPRQWTGCKFAACSIGSDLLLSKTRQSKQRAEKKMRAEQDRSPFPKHRPAVTLHRVQLSLLTLVVAFAIE